MSNSKQINSDKIQFEAPLLHKLSEGSSNDHYYFQTMKYNGEDFYFQSPWFVSNGLKTSPVDNKPDVKYKLDDDTRSILHIIQEEAIRQVKFPDGYNIEAGDYRKHFKCFQNSRHLFAKLIPFTTAFDENMNSINITKLNYGEYRVIGFVKGIYIGNHGYSLQNWASLQIKIVQIQYKAIDIKCLFDKALVMNYKTMDTPQPTKKSIRGRNKAKRGLQLDIEAVRRLDIEAARKT